MKTSKALQLSYALVQMEIDPEPQKNAETFLAYAREAVSKGADVIIGSEMMLTHYLSSDRYEDDDFVNEVWSVVQFVIDSWQEEVVLIFGGIGKEFDDSIGEDGRLLKYNAAFVVQNGQLISNEAGLPFAIKSLMPNYRIFDDSRYFFDLRKLANRCNKKLSDLQKPFKVSIKGEDYMLGVMLCEDMWSDDYSDNPARNLADSGADILINLSASPWSWRKNEKRDQIIRDICKETGLPFIYVNNVGSQNNGKNFLAFDGASTAYDVDGNIVLAADRYQEQVCILDPGVGLVKDRATGSDVEELLLAITTATKGFLKNLPLSIASKVVIGVSGGIDSALSVAFFAKLLGSENVIAVNMPYGDFNSEETKADAEEMCKRLGVEYRVIPIRAMVEVGSKFTGIEVRTSQHKTSQAIRRMAVLAETASQEQAFFTCNANMTEIAFGYGTLNGDMRGTFAPWMNCLKQDVYRLADYLNTEIYNREVIPESIIERPPMDELVADDGSDRGDPFDYGDLEGNGYHDQMVRAIVAFRRSPAWFLENYLDGNLEEELQLSKGKLENLFESPEQFVDDLERCFKLFNNAVFKRVQSVPGPLVDKRSFGFDFRESILPLVVTKRYKDLKEKVLLM